MQQTLPHGLLDAWFMVGEQLLRSEDRSLLGGWFKVWIGNPFEIHAMACVSKAFKPFLFTVCPICKRRWTYRRHFSHAYFMPMCRDRVVRANICFVCHGHHPFVDGRPGRSGRAPWPSWRTECVQCRLYKCTHRQVLPWRDIQLVRCPSPPLWPSPVSVSDCDVIWSDLQPIG